MASLLASMALDSIKGDAMKDLAGSGMGGNPMMNLLNPQPQGQAQPQAPSQPQEQDQNILSSAWKMPKSASFDNPYVSFLLGR